MLESVLWELDRLSVGHKVFCIWNHDVDHDQSMVVGVLENLWCTFLWKKSSYLVDDLIQLLWTPCFHSQYEMFDHEMLTELKQNQSDSMIKVLWSHDPAMVEHWFKRYCADWKNTLILSWHTHGWQFAPSSWRDRGNMVAKWIALEKLRTSSKHKHYPKYVTWRHNISQSHDIQLNISTWIWLHPSKPQVRTAGADVSLITIS